MQNHDCYTSLPPPSLVHGVWIFKFYAHIVVAAGGSISQFAYGVLFGLVAGMMVSICIKELLPTAMRYDPKDAIVTYSVVVGMAIMALSLVLFALASPEDDGE
mmetsp:Transcript_41099/g.66095  ORF Transcript_41099/g.66095 Transcript_41099/m.66095 type:complete len:103 (+) Transcript_41099:680-988(+)